MPDAELSQRHCTPCRGDTEALAPDAARELLARAPGWRLADSSDSISREFIFKNFHQTIAFVNALAWIAHREDHHPDLEVSYRRCLVQYSTHTIKGLSENDFICAARINVLLS